MSSEPGVALLDANILVYAEQAYSPYHRASKALRDRALSGEIAACVSPQVLNEFYAIVTNPGRVAEPLSSSEAIEEMTNYLRSRRLAKVYPGTSILDRELELLAAHPVAGPDIHDLHLAATMLENGVTRIYTYNTADFAPFGEIVALLPPSPGSECEPEQAESR